jgi:hypothetical protein
MPLEFHCAATPALLLAAVKDDANARPITLGAAR